MQTTFLVLVRHGESAYTSQNRFAGWTDVPLSDQGVEDAQAAGRLLLKSGIAFDEVHTSVLKRTVLTAAIILDHTDLCWIPQYKSWQLNERHYGKLEGRQKKETSQEFGVERVQRWRRSFNESPPEVGTDDPRWPGNHPRYRLLGVPPSLLPKAEAPADCYARVIAYFRSAIIPRLMQRKNVLVVAHGTPLRCLTKFLEQLTPEETSNNEFPSCLPVVYELDTSTLSVRSKKILMDETKDYQRLTESIRQQASITT